MEFRCPDCASPEVALIDRGSHFECGNCGATFGRGEAYVTVADADAYAEELSACTCDKVRGCPQCFQRADELAGALVRDHQGREWKVIDVDEKDGFPTVCGERYWDYFDQVEVLKPPPDELGVPATPVDPNRQGGS